MANSATLTLETIEQGLRFRAMAGSGQKTVTDSGPGRTAPSPVEMLLVALGGCMAMDVISILRKQRQKVHAYEVFLEGQRHVEHPRAFTRIEIVHRLSGSSLKAKGIEQAIDLSAMKYCSVYATLAKDVEIVNRHEIVPVGAG